MSKQFVPEYEYLNHITNNDNAYIDTGVPSNFNLKFYISFKDYQCVHGSAVFGSQGHWGNSLAIYGNTIVYCLSSYAYRHIVDINKLLSGELMCTKDGCDGSLDGIPTTLEKISDGNNISGNIQIFRGGVQIVAKATIYSFKIFDQNDILLRDFRPAKRTADGEVGMYDKVGNKFYTSQTASKFIGG